MITTSPDSRAAGRLMSLVALWPSCQVIWPSHVTSALQCWLQTKYFDRLQPKHLFETSLSSKLNYKMIILTKYYINMMPMYQCNIWFIICCHSFKENVGHSCQISLAHVHFKCPMSTLKIHIHENVSNIALKFLCTFHV